MTSDKTNQKTFFELLRAGLWEKDVQLLPNKDIDFSAIMRLAEEQSVVGLVAAGLEHVVDLKVPQQWALQFAGQTIQLEHRNKAMNAFVAELIETLRKYDVYAILVKGQGIAQCYEKALWRTLGDVDLLMSGDNYQKAKEALLPLATNVDEDIHIKHLEMAIDNWPVELHGTLRGGLWKKLDKVIDSCQHSVFYEGHVRSWLNSHTQIFMPRADEDVVLVFAHILQHFFKGGIGLRQVCDWCRLLYTYRDSLNIDLLGMRLKKAGIMSEWNAFATLAVEYLGMPMETIPFYSGSSRWKHKATRVLNFIMETGNFGHNRDESYKKKYPAFIRIFISFGRRVKDTNKQLVIFPLDALKSWWAIVGLGLRFVIKKIKV